MKNDTDISLTADSGPYANNFLCRRNRVCSLSVYACFYLKMKHRVTFLSFFFLSQPLIVKMNLPSSLPSSFDQTGFKRSGEFSFDQSQSPFGKVAQDAFAARPSSPKGASNKPVDWDRHVMLPLVITGYVQAVFNFIVVLGVLCCFYWFASAIQQDIDLKAESFRREVMSEIQTCAREYTANRCEPEDRIPAMQKMCETWKNCMAQGLWILVDCYEISIPSYSPIWLFVDPYVVARGKISAHTLAEIFNSFVEPISYKTMAFVCLLLITIIVGSNIGFGIGRRALSNNGIEGQQQLVVYKKKQ